MLAIFDKIFLTGCSFWTIIIALSLIALSFVFLVAGVCTHEKSFGGPFSNNETSYHLLLAFWILLNVAWGLFAIVCIVEIITSFVYFTRGMSDIEFVIRFIIYLVILYGLGSLVERIYGDGSRGVGRNTPFQRFQKYMEPPFWNK